MDQLTLGAVDQRSLSNERRIMELANELQALRKEHTDDMEKVHEEHKAIYELTTSVKIIAEHMEAMNNIVLDTNQKVEDIALAQQKSEEDLKKKIAEIENKPAQDAFKTMKKVKLEIILTIVGFVVGAALTFVANLITSNI